MNQQELNAHDLLTALRNALNYALMGSIEHKKPTWWACKNCHMAWKSDPSLWPPQANISCDGVSGRTHSFVALTEVE